MVARFSPNQLKANPQLEVKVKVKARVVCNLVIKERKKKQPDEYLFLLDHNQNPQLKEIADSADNDDVKSDAPVKVCPDPKPYLNSCIAGVEQR